MVVAQELAIDHRVFRIVPHARRTHDVAGAFRGVAMLDLRGAEFAEDLIMRGAGSGEACLDIGVETKGKARQRHAVDVVFVRIERHAVLGVGKLLHLRGEAEVS